MPLWMVNIAFVPASSISEPQRMTSLPWLILCSPPARQYIRNLLKKYITKLYSEKMEQLLEEIRDQIRDQQRDSWNKFSPGWKKWDKLFMDFLRPMGDEIINSLRPKGDQI